MIKKAKISRVRVPLNTAWIFIYIWFLFKSIQASSVLPDALMLFKSVRTYLCYIFIISYFFIIMQKYSCPGFIPEPFRSFITCSWIFSQLNLWAKDFLIKRHIFGVFCLIDLVFQQHAARSGTFYLSVISITGWNYGIIRNWSIFPKISS